MILQKRLQSLAIMESHLPVLSSSLVAFLIALLVCQCKEYLKA
jgi:hypothetical protein